jgi:acyl-coenzyme A synthetase/AMP-(fatty) acid ligase
MNFSGDLVAGAPSTRLAMVAVDAEDRRETWSFGETADAAARLGGFLRQEGVERGDVVVTLIGNRPSWVISLVACFHIGAIVLPCTEQLRAKDLAHRFGVTQPKAILADERNREELTAADPPCPVFFVSPDLWQSTEPVAAVELASTDPCLITFTSGTSGPPKAVVHAQRYLTGQGLQATHWLDARPGDLVWCTASSGWSKSARNSFVAPWINGATAFFHDGRFDPAERLELVAREGVKVLCMAPTEYRVIAKRAELAPIPGLRSCVAAGEALNSEIIGIWQEATGVSVRDGYGQTETGQITAVPLEGGAPAGSMGRPLPGIRAWIDDGELVLDPTTVPTFFTGYLGEAPPASGEAWRTGDRVVEDEDSFLHFVGRADDVIISSGYRIGPFEIESSLISHPAVADVAVVGAADDERGSIVRAVVVLAPGREPSDGLVKELQDYVKQSTAPYKYPRRIDFTDELPKTTSGKIRRNLLREQS